jgi:hypothetical protein
VIASCRLSSQVEKERKKEGAWWILFYHMHALGDEYVVLVFTTDVGEKTCRKKALLAAREATTRKR